MSHTHLRGKAIAVLLGGTSSERDVSLMSGATICESLDSLGVKVLKLDTAEPGWWRQLATVDAAFIILHGGDGEDGTVQGALQTLGMPYTGSGVLASALAMDKLRCKQMWQGIGLPTADFFELKADSDFAAVLQQLGAVFVKPATGGSSIGTAGARDEASLEQAWAQAAQYGDRVIAEQLIEGDEYTVAVLNGEALPAIKMETDNEFYDYQAKYFSDDTRYSCPCGLAPEEEAELGTLAVQAFESVGCESWGRVDFMRDRAGKFWILEVNTVPGMTGHSLVPMAAKAAGIELPELVGRIADFALQRGESA
jgi:D-alanine-D-alanine ligase